jgi:NAD-dependent SIR2 family protein deacetylase
MKLTKEQLDFLSKAWINGSKIKVEFEQCKCDLCGNIFTPARIREEEFDKANCPTCENTVYFEVINK